ncbi:hypothetical protein DPSP01_014790 [Paraphaeosphaeria sporulosa]|uniref:Uncharacterized protein n=1 Tax=Paraphaeosphaeria sporulosa TaxID=1460663 RepID=A0A177CG38_9PLEO|nr:uncharacterized protein CC84DRAFT_1164518 [Paraphaeosphaeria sporulosa]OAG06201.1 hypothetical protein CC84DRAFT_1164518 [Paraphaeosphaeria sporulosa]
MQHAAVGAQCLLIHDVAHGIRSRTSTAGAYYVRALAGSGLTTAHLPSMVRMNSCMPSQYVDLPEPERPDDELGEGHGWTSAMKDKCLSIGSTGQEEQEMKTVAHLLSLHFRNIPHSTPPKLS